MGIPRAYDDYRQMLDREKPDIVTLDLPLNADVMAILDAGVRSASSGRLEEVSCVAAIADARDGHEREL